MNPDKLNRQDANNGEYPQYCDCVDGSVFHDLEAIYTIYGGVFEYVFLFGVDARKSRLNC